MESFIKRRDIMKIESAIRALKIEWHRGNRIVKELERAKKIWHKHGWRKVVGKVEEG